MDNGRIDYYQPLLDFCVDFLRNDSVYSEFRGGAKWLVEETLQQSEFMIASNSVDDAMARLTAKAKCIAADRVSFQLVKDLIQNGSAGTWEQIVNIQYELLAARCERLLSSLRYYPGDVFDLVDETFIKASQVIQENKFRVDHYCSISIWLFTIAKNKAYNVVKRNRLWTNRPFIKTASIQPQCTNEVVPVDTNQASPITNLVHKDNEESLYQSILQLTTKSRHILERVLQGEKNPEIARELNLSIDMVRYRLDKAKRYLQSILSG